MKKITKAIAAVLTAIIIAALAAVQCFALSDAVYSMANRSGSLNIAGEGAAAAKEAGIDGYTFTNGSYLYDEGCTADFTKPFSVSVAARTGEDYTEGFAIIFAYNTKASAGHIEMYLQNGVVHIYAPGINGGNPVFSSIDLSDHKLHHIAMSYDGETMKYYDNGVEFNSWPVNGMAGAPDTHMITIGGLNEGGLGYSGFIGDLRIFDKVITADEVAALASSGETEIPVIVEEPTLLYEDSTIYEVNAGEGAKVTQDFEHNITDKFTISGFFNTASSEAFMILFAKGPKAAAHFEVYTDNGELAFYAPEIASGNAVKSGVQVTDGKDHSFAITYNGSILKFFIDGSAAASAEVGGSITPKTLTFVIGSLVEGGFGFNGRVGNIKIYNYDVGEEEALQLSKTAGQEEQPGTGEQPGSGEHNPPSGDASVLIIAAVSVGSLALAGATIGKRRF